MRLLWISASFPPAVGGMQTYNDELTARLAERHEVTVITAAGQRPRSTAVAHFECEGLRGAPDDLGWRRSRERVRELAARAAEKGANAPYMHWRFVKAVIAKAVHVC